MTPTSIDTLIFDLGGVLIDWNPEYLYRQLFDDENATLCFQPPYAMVKTAGDTG